MLRGKCNKAGHSTAYATLKTQGTAEGDEYILLSTFHYGKREDVYIQNTRTLVDHQLQKEQKCIYSEKKKWIKIISKHDKYNWTSAIKLAQWKKKHHKEPNNL